MTARDLCGNKISSKKWNFYMAYQVDTIKVLYHSYSNSIQRYITAFITHNITKVLISRCFNQYRFTAHQSERVKIALLSNKTVFHVTDNLLLLLLLFSVNCTITCKSVIHWLKSDFICTNSNGIKLISTTSIYLIYIPQMAVIL